MYKTRGVPEDLFAQMKTPERLTPEEQKKKKGMQTLWGLLPEITPPPASDDVKMAMSPEQLNQYADTGPDENLRLLQILASVASLFAPGAVPLIGLAGGERARSGQMRNRTVEGIMKQQKQKGDLSYQQMQGRELESRIPSNLADAPLKVAQTGYYDRMPQSLAEDSVSHRRLAEKDLTDAEEKYIDQAISAYADRDSLGNILTIPALLIAEIRANAKEHVRGVVPNGSTIARARKIAQLIRQNIAGGMTPEQNKRDMQELGLSGDLLHQAQEYINYLTKSPLERGIEGLRMPGK